jgi:hypothetical protein
LKFQSFLVCSDDWEDLDPANVPKDVETASTTVMLVAKESLVSENEFGEVDFILISIMLLDFPFDFFHQQVFLVHQHSNLFEFI